MSVNRHIASRLIRPVARAAFAGMAIGALGLTTGNAYAQSASPPQGAELVECATIVSLEKRLQMDGGLPTVNATARRVLDHGLFPGIQLPVGGWQ